MKTLIAVLAVLLLVVGLAACGGGGGDDSSATTAASAPEKSSGDSGEGSSSQGSKAKSGTEGQAGSGKHQSGDSGESEGGSGGNANNFTPKPHSDSGGGSSQFKVKGGDNSVQEFGEEAEGSELNAAATALHDFLDARAEGNWAAACEYLSKSAKSAFEKLAAQAKEVKANDCGGILEQLTNPAAKQVMKAEAEQANVGSLRIEGEHAFVIYKGSDGTVLAMPMANEGGDWKVASLAGTPLS